MRDPELVAVVRDVRGDTITAALTAEAVPGLTFSKGHAYQVGQVGAFVRIPIGLVDLFGTVVQVGAAPAKGSSDEDDRVAWAAPGDAWMRIELIAESPKSGLVQRGVSRYPAIGDPVHLVTADDLGRLFGTAGVLPATHIKIGHIANAPQLPATLNINTLLSRHSAVVGSTGTGKSSTVSSILHQLANVDRFPSARIVVIDVHGEYGGGLRDLASVHRVRISDSSSTEGETRGNLHLPYWALSVDEFVGMAFGGLDDISATAVRDWVLQEKRAYASRHPELSLRQIDITADTPLPFSVHKLWYEFHERAHATHTAQQDAQAPGTRAYQKDDAGNLMRGDAARVIAPTYRPLMNSGTDRVFMSASALNMRRQLEHLAGRLRDPRYGFLFTPGPWSTDLNGEAERGLGDFLAQWLGDSAPIKVADLSNVPSVILRDVVGVLLRVLYDALVWGRDEDAGGRKRPLLVVLEEAHRYLGDEGATAATVVDRIVKEGRKYGVGVMLVSQRPSEIRATVLSQVGTFVVLRLSNQVDRGLVRSTLPDSLGGLFDVVPVLRTGEAVLVGESVHLPSRALIDVPPAHRPDSADPCVVTADGSAGWNRSRREPDFDSLAKAWWHSGATRKE
ncbi:ATP-binding protein [Blastococcus sp. SYSU DS1021]